MRFGPLKSAWRLDLEVGCIRPVDDYTQIAAHLSQLRHRDGHLYPPEIVLSSRSPGGTIATPAPGRIRGASDDLSPIPNTGRPAAFWDYPATHELSLFELASTKEEAQIGVGALIVQAYAFLLKGRATYEGWGLEDRIPFDDQPPLAFYAKEAEMFLACAVRKWRSLPPDARRALTTSFYLYNRGAGYEHTWERFMVREIAAQALRTVVPRRERATRPPSARRGRGKGTMLGGFLDDLTMPRQEEVEDRITRWRNGLVHEGRWPAFHPHSSTEQSPLQDAVFLEFILEKALVAASAYESGFARAHWYTFSRCDFRPDPSLLERHRQRVVSWKQPSAHEASP